MILLATDTSSVTASVAVFEDDRLLYEGFLNNGLTHSVNFMPMVETALAMCGLTPGDVDMYALSVGPGSFTGLRIGVQTIKTMAYVNGKKCIPVSTIEALSHNVEGREIVPIMDARCNQVYCGIYVDGQERLAPCACAWTELVEKVQVTCTAPVFVGDGVKAYSDRIKELGGQAAPASVQYLRASSVALAAMKRLSSAIEPNELNPEYLRKPQAEREYDKKHGSV